MSAESLCREIARLVEESAKSGALEGVGVDPHIRYTEARALHEPRRRLGGIYAGEAMTGEKMLVEVMASEPGAILIVRVEVRREYRPAREPEVRR